MPKRRVTVDISHSDSEDEEESSSEQQIYEDGEYDDDEDFDSLKPEASNLKMNGTSVRRKSRSQHVTFSRSKSSSKTRSNSKNFKKAAPSQSSSDESDEDSESFVQPKTQPKKQLNGKHSLLDNNNLNGSNHIDNSKSKQRNTTTSSNSTTRKGRPKQTKSSTTQDIIISSDAEEPPPMKSVPQKTKTKSKSKLLPLYNSSDGESSSKSVASSEKHSSHENGNNLPLDQSGEMVIDDNNNMESNSLEDSVDTDNSVEQHNKTMAKEKLRQGNKSGKKMNGMRVRKAVANKSNIKLTNSTSDAGPQSDKSDPPSRRTSSITKQNEDEHTNGSSSEPNNSHRASPLRISKEDVDYDNSDSETVQQQNNNNEELDDQSGEESTTVSPPPKPAAKNRTEKTKRKKVMAKKPAKKKVLVESPSPQKKRKLFDPPSNLLEDIVFEGVEDESDEEMDVSQSFSVSSQNEEMNGLSQSIKDNLVVKTDMSDAEEINSVSLKSSSELDKSQTIQLSQTNLTQVNEISTQPIPGSPSEPHRNGIMNGQTVNNTTQFKKQPSFRLQLPNMSIKVYCDDKNKS